MKLLYTLAGLLLTINSYCYFDTIKAVPHFKKVEEIPLGSKVSQKITLPSEIGAYVIWLENIPGHIEEANIKITASSGVKVYDFQLKNPAQSIGHERSYEELQSEIIGLKENLTLLNKKESNSDDIQKLWITENIDLKDLSHYRNLIKEKRTSIRTQRLQTYKALKQLQENLSDLNSQLIETKSLKDATILYIDLIIHDSLASMITVEYWLPKETIAPNSTQASSKSKRIVLKGRIIESANRLPMVYVLIEYYHDKELLGTTYTNENGIFELNLPHDGPFTLKVMKEGYRNSKVRQLTLKNQWQNYRTIAMKAKNPISVIEVLSYALPLIDIVQSNIK